jgi:hypothetical protein
MVPETNLKRLVQIDWWNPPPISLGQFFRWSVKSNAGLAPAREALKLARQPKLRSSEG